MITLDAINLHEDFIWTNEFKESPVAQSKKYSLSGALIVTENLKLKGRIITLHADELSGWIERSVIKALEAKQKTMTTMVLTLNDARTFNVRFDSANNPINARPIIDYNNPVDTDNYQATLNFFEV